MSRDEIINEHLKAALESLDNAMSEILSLSREEPQELYSLALLGRSIGLIREFQNPIFIRNPELKPSPPDDYIPDGGMNENQEELASKLLPEKLKQIDEVLLSYAHSHYSKVAALVGKIMFNESVHVKGLPDVFYSQRVKHLVKIGLLESQGNLEMMRYSEVRLPKQQNT